MRRGLPVTLAISLGAHVVVATAALLAPSPRVVAPVDPDPQLAGETFELPAPETAELPPSSALASSEPESPAEQGAPPAEEGDAPAPTRPPTRAARTPRPPRAETGSGADATPALYGAVGERSAADLATAFTRGFPQAASADPLWRRAPLGSAGEADIVLTLDESGHIERVRTLGAPSPALTSAIHRTLALIKGRPFVSKSKFTKLHLVASVSADAVHDGLHGDVFAIGGSFAGGEGNAFFALAIGRRIDVRVRAR